MTSRRAALAVVVLIAGASVAAVHAQRRPQRTFKVATWNIRSGQGVRGFDTKTWSSETPNCTDQSKPLNAWGIGLPQRELERLKADASIVAVALQEAWGCGSPQHVNGILEFRGPAREQEGVALLARYGFHNPPAFQEIDAARHRWIARGDVCLDPACTAAMTMVATHLGGEGDQDFPPQAERLLAVLAGLPVPHLFMGDLNLFRIDRWNPQVPCTQRDTPGRVNAISAIERAGYQDTWKALEPGEGWTGMASRKGCGSPPGSFYKRIDYVYTKGLQPISIRRFAQPPAGGDAASDHAGLIAEFAWPEPAVGHR